MGVCTTRTVLLRCRVLHCMFPLHLFTVLLFGVVGVVGRQVQIPALGRDIVTPDYCSLGQVIIPRKCVFCALDSNQTVQIMVKYENRFTRCT